MVQRPGRDPAVGVEAVPLAHYRGSVIARLFCAPPVECLEAPARSLVGHPDLNPLGAVPTAVVNGPERLIGCGLNPTRYDQAVAALGGHGEYVQRLEELPAALQRALDSGLPALVNVEIEGLAAPAGAGH